jgi:hypothetical protein
MIGYLVGLACRQVRGSVVDPDPVGSQTFSELVVYVNYIYFLMSFI